MFRSRNRVSSRRMLCWGLAGVVAASGRQSGHRRGRARLLQAAAAAAKASAAVDRLTDTTRYTGAHKQRFDESGKGKGLAGRKEVNDSSGYVQGYQNKNTYDKNHL